MHELPRVIVTGTDGFLGGALVQRLTDAGCSVWGISRRDARPRTLRADLLFEDQARQAFAQVPAPCTLIHAAAEAHGRPQAGRDRRFVNETITDNILRAAEGRVDHVVFLSSVAVYGEWPRSWPVGHASETRPVTAYGRGKLACEGRILRCPARSVDIVRLPPVFDPAHLNDVAKRVYLPGTRLKMRVEPEPVHSLCRLSTAVEAIAAMALRPSGRGIHLLCDGAAYGQHELARWFPRGPTVVLPAALGRLGRRFSRLVPGATGELLWSMWWKLFEDNTFEPGTLALDAVPAGGSG